MRKEREKKKNGGDKKHDKKDDEDDEFGMRRYIYRGLNISSCVARIPFDVDIAYY